MTCLRSHSQSRVELRFKPRATCLWSHYSGCLTQGRARSKSGDEEPTGPFIERGKSPLLLEAPKDEIIASNPRWQPFSFTVAWNHAPRNIILRENFSFQVILK